MLDPAPFPHLTPEGERMRLWIDAERSFVMAGESVPWVRRKCKDGFHEPKLSQMMLSLAASRTGAFFDIGALYGYFALLVGAASDHARDIHAFEMNEASAQITRRNVTLNNEGCGTFDNTRVRHVALSARDENRPAIVSGFKLSLDDNATDAESVRFRTIDRYCARQDVMPAFIKIDVEGWEGLVLNGMLRTLRLAKPVLAMELHGKPMVSPSGLSRVSITQLLLALGYRCYVVRGYRDNGPIDVIELTDPDFAPLSRRFENMSTHLMIASVDSIEATFPDLDFTVTYELPPYRS